MSTMALAQDKSRHSSMWRACLKKLDSPSLRQHRKLWPMRKEEGGNKDGGGRMSIGAEELASPS